MSALQNKFLFLTKIKKNQISLEVSLKSKFYKISLLLDVFKDFVKQRRL